MNRKPVEPSNRRIRQLFAIWNDPQRMKKKKTKTCANCTLNCDASIKFACSKFPKPCYESVNFEICCRSIIMDGFRYNCVGSVYSRFSVQSLHAKVPVLPSKRQEMSRATASIKATDELQRQQQRQRQLQWLPLTTLSKCPISVSVSVSLYASVSVAQLLLLLSWLW